MNIAIIGAGAVGTIIAHELKQTLPNVTLIGRQSKQMTIHPPNQTIQVQDIKETNTTFDTIIIAVKTHPT